jgi:hypothetical protein
MSEIDENRFPIAIVFIELDNLLIDNYWRKYQTYLQLGWNDQAIAEFLAQKSNKLQIASFEGFNTNDRYDRFYSVYEQPEMLTQDVASPGAVEMVQTLVEGTYCIVLSSRPTTQQSATKQQLQRLGFPVEKMEFFFRSPDESVMGFQNKTLTKLHKRFLLGFGICHSVEDSVGFDRIRFPAIAMTTIYDINALAPYFEKVCEDWEEIGLYLMTLIKNIPKSKFDSAMGQLIANTSSHQVRSSVNVGLLAARFEAEGLLGGTDTQEVFDRAEQRAQTQSILDQAVFQQLFSGAGSDRILGANANQSIKIENVEFLLNSFMVELKNNLSLIECGRVGEFFSVLSQRYQLDLTDVQQQVEANLVGCIDGESDANVGVYITVTKLVEKLRNISFEHFAIGWISWLFYETTKQTFDGPARDKFNQLLNDNDPDISLLYNVSFILWLTHLYPDTPYSEPIKAVIQAHTQKVITRLL